MRPVFNVDGCRLDGGVIAEVGAYQPAVPRPVILGIARRMNADVAMTGPNIPLERRLLEAASERPMEEVAA